MSIPVNLLTAHLDAITVHTLNGVPTEDRSKVLQAVAEVYNLIDRHQRDEINAIMKSLVNAITEGLPDMAIEAPAEIAVEPKPLPILQFNTPRFQVACIVCGAGAGEGCFQMTRRGSGAKPTRKPLKDHRGKPSLHARRGK